jgi:hypothetical protein
VVCTYFFLRGEVTSTLAVYGRLPSLDDSKSSSLVLYIRNLNFLAVSSFPTPAFLESLSALEKVWNC